MGLSLHAFRSLPRECVVCVKVCHNVVLFGAGIATEAAEDTALTLAFTDELNQMTKERVARDPNYSGERFPSCKEFYKL